MPNTKNILFIMCDQLRWDYLSCYGHPKLKTPHIDSLAARGVRFDRAYCQSPVCGSSRMSFYTGRYVNSHGASWNFVPLRIGEMTIGDHLRPRGIRTALVGKTHMRADYPGLARLGVDLDSQEGVFAAECGFEPFERDDGIHPSSSHDPFPRYNEYLREQGFGGDNPWEDWANSAEGPNGEILSGWYWENAKFPARIPAEHSETAYITGRAIDFIDEAGAEPWCLHLSYIKPHWPYMAPAPYATLYGPEDTYPPIRCEEEKEAPHPVYGAFIEHRVSQTMSRDKVRNSVLPAYMGMIKQIDDEIGRLLRFMEEQGRMEDTLIAFTSDHGDYLGDHWLGEKDLFHEPSVRVPLIVYDPSPNADPTRGSVNTDLVEAIDLAPTFVDATGGYEQPHIFDGHSLIPLLHGKTPSDWRNFVISEYDYAFTDARHVLAVPPSECWLRMIFDGRYKYIVCERFGPMLFDLESDPQEFVNLGDDPAYAAERARLDKLLLEWALKPRQRVTIAEGTLNAMDVQRNISEAGVLIGYYDEADRDAAWEKWADRPIFATFNPIWAKAQKKTKGKDPDMTFSAVEIDKLMSSTKPVGGMIWNVMGQIYIPKKVDDRTLWWEAIMPEETFIPPHAHSTQDEFLYLTEGELDMTLDGKEVHAGPGDIIPFPKYSTHALFNNCGETAKGVFWAEPTNKLFDLFKALHNVADPHEVVRISDDHDIHFQLPGQEPRTKKHFEAG